MEMCVRNKKVKKRDALVKPPIKPSENESLHAVIRNRNLRWHNNVVPFVLTDRFSPREKITILSALSQLQSKTCFKFVNRNQERDFLYIDKLDGCFSYVGKLGGQQLVSLGEGCVFHYIIWHEIMHALGIEHEHQRPDRDNYIDVIYQNVEPGSLDQFDKVPYNSVNLITPYDYHSIMHYDAQAFGKFDPKLGNFLVTMVPKRKGVKIYDPMFLSASDFKKLNYIADLKSYNWGQNLDAKDENSNVK